MVTSCSNANTINNLDSLELTNFCELQVEQIANQSPIFFVRLVFFNSSKKKPQEVINYPALYTLFVQNNLNYWRSEQWLIDYPPVFILTKIKMEQSQFFGYFCALGYKNQQPEYIQIISSKPLSNKLQEYIQTTAKLLNKYIELYSEWQVKKSEIKLLEQILQRASHQLRNSFALISLYAQNLYWGLKDNPWQEQAEIIRDSIQKLDTNLTEMIGCSQSNCLRLMPHDLKQVIEKSLKELQPLIEQKKLKINLSKKSITVMIDSLQMKQVFDNLFSNAIYFSPKSGNITCNWQIFQGEVLIKIADEGPGLSEEDLQKIFTPFYSRREQGTGLGLTIAKKIILDHQGSLWAQNLKTGGAQFSLIIPRKNKV